MKFLLCIILLFTSQIVKSESGLPNHSLTPGAFNLNVVSSNIRTTICIPKYSKMIRPSANYTNKLKVRQIKEYGYSNTNLKDYEEDHLLPLSLGGNPADPKNLWPQPRFGEWDAIKKDRLENWAHRAVCLGIVPLEEIQQMFVSNWIDGYKKYIKQ
jgi:hypothetical protein